jgi:hypothetical protein
MTSASPRRGRFSSTGNPACASVPTHLDCRFSSRTAASFLCRFLADSSTQPPCRSRRPVVLQSFHACQHAPGALAVLRRNVPRSMACRAPGVPRVRRGDVHCFRCLWRPRSLAAMEDASRPVADRICNILRADDGRLRSCIFPPRPPRQVDQNG